MDKKTIFTGKIKNAALAVMLLTVVSNAFGLVRESVLAAFYGASYQTDAYKIAYSIPSILLAIISAAIATTFIPVYSEYIRNKKSEDTCYFLNNIFNTVFLISVALIIFGGIFTEYIVRTVAPGFEDGVTVLAVRLTLIMLPSIAFLALSNLAGSYLQANKRFIATATIGIPSNIIIIGSIAFFKDYGITAVAAGSLIAVASQFAVQLPVIVKSGYRFKPVFLDFKEEGIRRIIALSLPVFINRAFGELYIIVDRMFASGLSEGSITALDFAAKINGTLYNIFICSILTVIYPSLAYLSDNKDSFMTALTKAARVIMLVSLPVMSGIMVLRTPIVGLLFERGAFESQDTNTTSLALGCLSVSFFGMGIGELLSKAFYSLKDTKTPMVNGIVTSCINIVLSAVLVKFRGVAGLAAAVSISTLIGDSVLVFLMGKKVKFVNKKELAAFFLKAAVSSSVMGLFLYAVNNTIFKMIFGVRSFLAGLAALTIAALSGAAVYAGAMYLLKVEEIYYFTDIVKNKFKHVLSKRIGTSFHNIHMIYKKVLEEKCNMERYPVIMAGGGGTRFWPLSRESKPKYLLNISGNDILLNETIKRLEGIAGIDKTFVVTVKKQEEVINRNVLSDLPRNNILIEPFGRNTAACIAYSAMVISAIYKDGIMCIFPSDHMILNLESFRQTISKACNIAEKTGKLVTIGIKPSFPSTGYGYIRYSKEKYKGFENLYEVEDFIEKPDIEKARAFVESGGYLWNSGIFIWKASSILDNILRYLPRLYKSISKVKEHIGTKNEQEALETAYNSIQDISIDTGILERSDDVLTMSGDFGWSDIGSWDALEFVSPRDENGNIVKAKHIGLATNNSVIYGSDRLIATIGLDGYIVADTEDALMICPKEMSQEVRKLVEILRDKGLDMYI